MVIVVKYLLAGHAVGFTGWLCAVALCFVLSLVAAGLVYEFVDKPITRRPEPNDAVRPPPPYQAPDDQRSHPVPRTDAGRSADRRRCVALAPVPRPRR